MLLLVRVLYVSTAIDFGGVRARRAGWSTSLSPRGWGGIPMDHFLEIVVLCLVALNLSRSCGGRQRVAARVVHLERIQRPRTADTAQPARH